ncbi:MAG: caspase family protein, partial [Novosphingobium sp.]
MRWLGLLLALLTFSITAPAAAKIRAVFIGIDKYAYSRTEVPFADFKDLHGAVNDARAIKRTLASVYGLDFDDDGSGCSSENAQSITLINQCATRKAIFAAWNRQIAASAPGDTLILYFAGHGSRFIDDQEFRQASGYNGTILPYDARNPKPAPGAVQAEIRDVEIKEVIDAATAKGVNVVTIFDSCNSGTITRDGPADGQSRWAP